MTPREPVGVVEKGVEVVEVLEDEAAGLERLRLW